jgi:hypothetical protein
VKPVDVDPERVELHDTDSNELSMSIASVSTLPHLEAIDAERVLNEEEKKARKEARRLKREERRREGKLERRKKKKSKPPTHPLVSSLAALKMVTMMCPTKFIARGIRKERAREMTTTNMPPYPLTIPLCL